jgi:hypothetical protein
MPACTSSAITGSIDTASCLLSMPVSIRQRTSAYARLPSLAASTQPPAC